MTFDEQLRQTLDDRARELAPSPDPLRGIERRARGLRHRRVVAAVASSALAVLAVAGVGGALLSGSAGTSELAVAPSPSPRPSAAPPPAPGLDPERPWRYRGQQLAADTLATFRREWETAHRGSELVPLFGQVYDASGQLELVFLARGPGASRWGVVATGEAGPELLVDAPLASGALSLAAALPGEDGLARLLVVAAPETGAAAYAPDGTTWRAMPTTPSDAPGVHITSLVGDPARDRYRVVSGAVVVDEQEAPDARARAPRSGAAPADVLDWPARGAAVDPDLLLQARRAFAGQRHVEESALSEKLLMAGAVQGGSSYLMIQFWVAGDARAETVSVVGSGHDLTYRPYGAVGAGVDLLAMTVPQCCSGGGDLLVLVPRPGAGQVLYGAGGTGFRPVDDDATQLDGVALVRRDLVDRADRLRLLDGDGQETGTYAVTELLCGAPCAAAPTAVRPR